MTRKDNVKTGKKITKGEKYDMLSPMLDAVLLEIRELSKKKQDGVLNELKVNMINKILEQIKELLSDEPTVQFIELLDNETLPTNSDAVLIIAQFRAAMDHFKEKYYRYDDERYEHRWFTK